MADSDEEYLQDPSDEEYTGGKSSHGTRAHRPPKKRHHQQQQIPKQQAWESNKSLKAGLTTYKEGSDGTIQQSVQERGEERKRKRLRKDTKPFQRGIIRHVTLVLDISEAMADKDMRPNRYVNMINYSQDYVREFFEQNPISQMSVLGMHDGVCIRVSELSGNPTNHITAIQGLRYPTNPKDVPREPRGSPSLQNALELARATLFHTPSHGTREVIIVFGALRTVDPGDIHATITKCVRDRLRVSIIGMAARLKICSEIVSRTNAGDESEYVVATDKELLREHLLATTTPPVVRSSNSGQTGPTAAENKAALMPMGFPSRIVEDTPSLCACHGVLSRGGYTCSRCQAKVCNLPITCPSCRLTLLLSTHLARSYHHLFPLRNWVQVSWTRAREKGSLECASCLSAFPEPPPDAEPDAMDVDTTANAGGKAKASPDADNEDDEEEDLHKASESARYECRECKNHFCVDCDVFCHTVLHNCPGCLSTADLGPETLGPDEDVTMAD